MTKYILDEFANYQFRQMQLLVDRVALIEAHETLSARLMPNTTNADGTINEDGMEAFTDSIKSYQAAMGRLTALALEYGVTAIAPATINIGDRFISFKTWIGLSYIAFTDEDKRALCKSKTALVSGLIGALNAQKSILYCEPHRVTVGEERISYFAPSKRSKFVDRCMQALWVDVDTHPDKYLSKRHLEAVNGLIDPIALADKPSPDADLKVSILTVSIYNSFDQEPITFKPLPPWQFEIFYLTELEQIRAL